MGKKGEKKENLDTAVASVEPLPTILEEEVAVELKPTKSVKSVKGVQSGTKSKSILKIRSRSNVRVNDDKKRTISQHISLDVTPETKTESQIFKAYNEQIEQETGRSKSQETFDDEDEDKPKKGKKAKKGKQKGSDKEPKPKKGKKDKKEKPEAAEDDESKPKQEISQKSLGSASVEREDSKSEKIEKRDQKDEAEGTEAPTKKGKGKKAKVKKATKGTQKDADDELEPTKSLSRTGSKLKSQHSRVSFSSKTLVDDKKIEEERERSKSLIQTGEEKKRRKSSVGSKTSLSQSSSKLSSMTRVRSRSSAFASESVLLSESQTGRKIKGWVSSSRVSEDTESYSFGSTDSDRLIRDEKLRKGKKGKKGKKDKKQKEESREPSSADLEKKGREKSETKSLKDEQKAEKKAEKKAAKQEVSSTIAGKKAKVGADDHDDVKKKYDELKKVLKEMGIIDELNEEHKEEGPKKKLSKKEKARLTAEAAEKARAELEAQTKRMEELIRKRKEEERLAAIEKDKRETIEYGWRMEQLSASNALIQDIIDTHAEIVRKEKELLEWKKYVECGSLPNPSQCDQMNTYLHLWGLDLDTTSMETASKMTQDAIKLLGDLDDLIDTVTEEEKNKLTNWKWVRQLFRDYQASSLDVATYRLLRDVEHKLNRINIPTADFNFKDDYVTLCIWLRVMLPIPLPNPRRPPKPRIDITFSLMDVNVLFPITIDCTDAAIRAMYLKYDHLSDLCETFNMPEVPKDYYMDLLSIAKKEWRTRLKYKFINRDKSKSTPVPEIQQQDVAPSPENTGPEHKTGGQEKPEAEKTDNEQHEEFDSDQEIPAVPFQQLKPTPSEFAVMAEETMYNETRANLLINVPEHVINLRKFVILGGVYHLNLFAQPPQPQDFITMEMTLTGLYLPKQLEALPFKVVYTPYVPPEPEPVDSNSSIQRKLPEELEEEQKKQDEELDKLLFINIKWPQHVIFLELPIVCRWDEATKHWSKEEIHDLKHNEEKCILSFRTGVFGIYGLATYRYVNLPFQAYDIKPEIDGSVTVQLTAAILMLEFNIQDGLISITQLQNSPNMTLQDVVGKYFKLHQLKRMMMEAGIDIFPSFDAFCYVDGSCEKQWPMEKHLYYNMAQMANSFNFSWSRWNLQAGRRKIVLQMRQYSAEKKKQKGHQMLLVTPLRAAFIECTEVSQTFSKKEIDSLKFCADLYHLMKSSSGIFVRNKVMKASKQNVYALAEFLKVTRILSFS